MPLSVAAYHDHTFHPLTLSALPFRSHGASLPQVQKIKREWEEWNQVALDGPQFDVSEGEPFSMWRNGGVDPRALGCYAALWHVFSYGSREWEETHGCLPWGNLHSR